MTKHYKLHELTTEVLVEMFGDSSDWYSVLKNGKRVGSFSDLRKAIIKRQEKEASKLKQKREQSELNKSNTVRSTSDAKRFLNLNLKMRKFLSIELSRISTLTIVSATLYADQLIKYALELNIIPKRLMTCYKNLDVKVSLMRHQHTFYLTILL